MTLMTPNAVKFDDTISLLELGDEKAYKQVKVAISFSCNDLQRISHSKSRAILRSIDLYGLVPALDPTGKDSVDSFHNNIFLLFGLPKLLSPRRKMLRNRQMKRKHGVILLGIISFPSYSKYTPPMAYHFGLTANRYLISLNAFVRGIFITFVFPNSNSKKVKDYGTFSELEKDLPTGLSELAREARDCIEEPIPKPCLENTSGTLDFELYYILTGSPTLRMPALSGAGSSARAVLFQMCITFEKTEVLGAVTLVDMVARLTTSQFRSRYFGASD
ncbi:major facilitator superfamily transporter [Diplocarpon rosae]|nr:major facilitator superfamily transporter [Diplocarpon rosae]